MCLDVEWVLVLATGCRSSLKFSRVYFAYSSGNLSHCSDIRTNAKNGIHSWSTLAMNMLKHNQAGNERPMAAKPNSYKDTANMQAGNE